MSIRVHSWLAPKKRRQVAALQLRKLSRGRASRETEPASTLQRLNASTNQRRRSPTFYTPAISAASAGAGLFLQRQLRVHSYLACKYSERFLRRRTLRSSEIEPMTPRNLLAGITAAKCAYALAPKVRSHFQPRADAPGSVEQQNTTSAESAIHF